MKWYGILSFVVLIFLLAGIVYLGGHTDRIGMNFGEPSAISKQNPTPQLAIETTITSSQPTSTNDVCSNVDGYCMNKYGMSNSAGYNSCVQSIMYSCNPELKNTKWSKNTCDRLEQELIEIRIAKSSVSPENSYLVLSSDLMQEEYEISQDILYHCD